MDETKIENQGLETGRRPLSVLERLTDIFTSPQVVFDDLIARPRLIFPIAAMALGYPLLYIARYPIYVEFMRRTMIKAMEGQSAQLPPETMQMMLDWAPLIQIVAQPFSNLIAWLLLAVYILIVIKIFKGKGSFVQILSVSGYPYAILLLYIGISCIVSVFTGEILLNDSLALLVPSLKGTYVYGILREMSIFSVWWAMLVAEGTVRLSGISRPKIYGSLILLLGGIVLAGAQASSVM